MEGISRVDQVGEMAYELKINPKEIAEKLGLSTASIYNYMMRYRDSHDIDIEIPNIKENDDKKIKSPWELKIESEWNNMQTAADLLKSGQGRIVREKVKGKIAKYTVRK